MWNFHQRLFLKFGMITCLGQQHILSEFTSFWNENCPPQSAWIPLVPEEVGCLAKGQIYLVANLGTLEKRISSFTHSACTILCFIKDANFSNCRSTSSFFTVGFFPLVHYVEFAFKMCLSMTHLQFTIFCSDIFRAVTKIIVWQNMVGAGE